MLTVLFGPCAICGRFRGYYAFTGLFGDGDHEVMNLLKVEVCHGGWRSIGGVNKNFEY